MRSLVGLSDGTLDCGMAVRLEGMRPKALQSEEWVERQFAAVRRGLARLEQELDVYAEGVNLVGISVACTLGWLAFRFGDMNWLAPHPKLAAWYETFASRESMHLTAPGQPL